MNAETKKPASGEPILEVRHLVKHFPIYKGALRKKQVGKVHAVDDVSFSIAQGETLGLVGESGCGKSTTARTIVRLQDPTSGEVLFRGTDLSTLKGGEMRRMRQNIQMIFQDPYASLNPRMRVGEVLREPLMEHGITRDRGELDRRVKRMLELVGLDPQFENRFPHEFSGGQRQRIGIARALMLEPSLIICDEPISALDVSVQAQIVNLLEDLQRELGLSYLFVAHDLSMIRHISHRVAIMYLGALVEVGDCGDIYQSPLHPYTQAFLSAVPVPDPAVQKERGRVSLEGEIPSAIAPPSGCRFRTRCRHACPRCAETRPEMRELSPGHWVACHLAGGEPGTRPA
ncbi:MAG: ATP-binding cassette domain-containing protein [Angelakisella sp.]|jgi:oligopeptide transport system ATP-binding protein|nr:ATP-binding cassette domain-containing protein [Angelakisella sp.]